ncbi:MAG: hypothetical protein JNL80_16915 [Phycisphaerae bacterium]|jgi:hypothetical protein|nr:hypothetical protein [Phycisphaerae bacterium]
MATDTATGSSPDVCRVVLESKTHEQIVISIPGSSYRLQLTPTVAPQAISTPEGKRLSGVIRGKALRMHLATGGGRFIEPVNGHPRIVQGTVISIDPAHNRVLVNMVVPAWLDLAEGQKASDFAAGQLVNMYVESGMTFTPTA